MSESGSSKRVDQTTSKINLLKASKSTEQFNKLNLSHRHNLLTMTTGSTEDLQTLETSLLYNFVTKGKRELNVPIDFYHSDYQLRALRTFHGLECTDSSRQSKIYASQPIKADTKLYDYVITRQKGQPTKKNEQE